MVTFLLSAIMSVVFQSPTRICLSNYNRKNDLVSGFLILSVFATSYYQFKDDVSSSLLRRFVIIKQKKFVMVQTTPKISEFEKLR